MAEIIRFGNYAPPSPATYEVTYGDINGNDSQVEDGTSYIERVRTDIPTIRVAWQNLSITDVYAICDAVNDDLISVYFFYGAMRACDMTASDRALKLVLTKDDMSYWDLSFTLKG